MRYVVGQPPEGRVVKWSLVEDDKGIDVCALIRGDGWYTVFRLEPGKKICRYEGIPTTIDMPIKDGMVEFK